MNAKKFFLIDILFIFYLNFFFKKKDIIKINKKPKIGKYISGNITKV